MIPEAILFDCDGVLVDSEVIYGAVELEWLTRIGLRYDPDTYRTRFTGLDPRSFTREIRADHAAQTGTAFPDTFFNEMNAEIRRRLDRDLTAVSGIKDLLDRLSDRPMAVASSSRLERLTAKLRQTGLIDRFAPHIYSGEQVPNGKPSPDLFLFAAARLGVAPPACLVIEDSVNGVKAGRAAGMTVWGFAGGGHADARLAERLIQAGAQRAFSSHDQMAAAFP